MQCDVIWCNDDNDDDNDDDEDNDANDDNDNSNHTFKVLWLCSGDG